MYEMVPVGLFWGVVLLKTIVKSRHKIYQMAKTVVQNHVGKLRQMMERRKRGQQSQQSQKNQQSEFLENLCEQSNNESPMNENTEQIGDILNESQFQRELSLQIYTSRMQTKTKSIRKQFKGRRQIGFKQWYMLNRLYRQTRQDETYSHIQEHSFDQSRKQSARQQLVGDKMNSEEPVPTIEEVIKEQLQMDIDTKDCAVVLAYDPFIQE